MKRIIFLVTILLLVSSLTKAQSDNDYAKVLKKMFKVSGTETAFKSAISKTLLAYKQQSEEVDEKIWDELEKEFFKPSTIDALTVKLVPVYKKYLSINDLKDLIKFYQSAAGKKYVESTPYIAQESVEIGAQWGAQIGAGIEQKMKGR